METSILVTGEMTNLMATGSICSEMGSDMKDLCYKEGKEDKGSTTIPMVIHIRVNEMITKNLAMGSISIDVRLSLL